MTIDEAVTRIKSATAGTNKSKPVADELIADLCDALWNAAEYPQIQLLREHLPFFHERAITAGFHAWRKLRGLHLHYPRWANPFIGGPMALAARVSPEIATAPLTFFDPANDGRWSPPHPKVVAYLASIANQSLRDSMALYSLINPVWETSPCTVD